MKFSSFQKSTLFIQSASQSVSKSVLKIVLNGRHDEIYIAAAEKHSDVTNREKKTSEFKE